MNEARMVYCVDAASSSVRRTDGFSPDVMFLSSPYSWRVCFTTGVPSTTFGIHDTFFREHPPPPHAVVLNDDDDASGAVDMLPPPLPAKTAQHPPPPFIFFPVKHLYVSRTKKSSRPNNNHAMVNEKVVRYSKRGTALFWIDAESSQPEPCKRPAPRRRMHHLIHMIL